MFEAPGAPDPPSSVSIPTQYAVISRSPLIPPPSRSHELLASSKTPTSPTGLLTVPQSENVPSTVIELGPRNARVSDCSPIKTRASANAEATVSENSRAIMAGRRFDKL